MTTIKKANTDALFDYVAEHPEGFTRYDVERDLGWDYNAFTQAVREVRRVFADDDLNLVCDPQGKGEAWLYRLVGTWKESKGWVDNRRYDAEARLGTMLDICRTVINATDGRSREAHRAKIMVRYIERAQEDLAQHDEMLNGKV